MHFIILRHAIADMKFLMMTIIAFHQETKGKRKNTDETMIEDDESIAGTCSTS